MSVSPDLSVVIPVYNEKENLPELIDRCLAACRTTGRHFEIILVDDGSRDGSRDLILQAADQYAEIIGIILNRNYGQHAAMPCSGAGNVPPSSPSWPTASPEAPLKFRSGMPCAKKGNPSTACSS